MDREWSIGWVGPEYLFHLDRECPNLGEPQYRLHEVKALKWGVSDCWHCHGTD